MRNSFDMIFSIFSILAGFISPFITILFGILLNRAEDLLQTVNLYQKGNESNYNRDKTIKLIKLIGLLLIIVGALRFIDNILGFLRSLLY